MPISYRRTAHPTTAVAAAALAAILAVPGVALAQSSSLFVSHRSEAPPAPAVSAVSDNRLSPAIAQTSFSAVVPPPPRQFALNDLITIVIREQVTSNIDANLEAEKQSDYRGEISEFPRLTLQNLANLQLQPSALDNGPIKLGINYDGDFKGEGQYDRSDAVSGRITARIIDIKPNGTLVLEARKQIKTDNEGLSIVLTGTCRTEDVAVDNTVLSTQLYDLHLNKQATGELRHASQKGWLTKILDTIFNF